MNSSTIGVDISKDTLDAYRMSDGASRRFANAKTGHRALIAWIGGEAERVVFEPTGPYHRVFERALAKAGLPLVKVNPRQARRFAEATGKLAKTDRLDAALLARMGEASEMPFRCGGALLAIEPRPAPSKALAELKEFHIAREALVKDRTAAKNRAKIRTLALLKRQNAQRLDQIERQIAAIDAAILAFIEADAELAKRLAILTSISGVSRITAFALLIEMPELGPSKRRQAASLAGLAPVARQSGRWTGRAFIRGGRPSVRKALYMPALVAARFNPDLKATYTQLALSSSKPASPQNLPSPPSCVSSSSSPTPSSEPAGPGHRNSLD